jgi:hypothetical protein
VEVNSRENAEHYVWGDSCDGWHLVRASNLSVIGECMPTDVRSVALPPEIQAVRCFQLITLDNGIFPKCHSLTIVRE